MGPRWIALVTLVSALGASRGANAHCLTTTVNEPRGYDPAVSGCWTSGVTVAWPDASIDLQVDAFASRKVPFEVARRIVDESFAKWSSVECKLPGALTTDAVMHPKFRWRDLGAKTVDVSDCTTEECEHDRLAENRLILFRDDEWPNADGAVTYALTTLTYRTNSGRVVGAFMEVNTADHDFVEHAPSSGPAVALDYVITHEAGHFLGLAHSNQFESIMYRAYRGDSDASLRPDDVGAICAIRAATPPSQPEGCGCGVPRSSSQAGTVSALCVAAIALTRRRRTPVSVSRHR